MFSEKYSTVSRTNSRRRQVTTGNVFPKYILTAWVAWSIFHGKAAALQSNFDLCLYSWCFNAPQRLWILQAPVLQSWDRLTSKDLRCLGPGMGTLDLWVIQEQKAMPKLPGFLRQSWDQESHKISNRFSSQLCCRTSRHCVQLRLGEAQIIWSLFWGLSSIPVWLMRDRRHTPYCSVNLAFPCAAIFVHSKGQLSATVQGRSTLHELVIFLPWGVSEQVLFFSQL